MDMQRMRDVSSPQAQVFVLNPEGTRATRLTRLVSIEFDQYLNDVGQLKLECELNETSQMVLVDAHPDASIPVIVQVGSLETVWFTTHVIENYDGPRPTVQVVAVSPEKFLETLFAWPDPIMPAEAQISKHGVRFGPVAHVVKTALLGENFFRMLKVDWHSVHTVAPIVKADDYTPWVTVSTKMNNELDLIRSLLDNAHLTLTATLYLPGRGQTPPKGKDASRPWLVWDVVQRAEIPSGGLFLRGLMRSVADFWKDVWATVANSTSQSANSVEYWGKPQLMVRRHQYASLRIETVKPTAWRYTVGGQAPEWLNSLIQMGVGTAINVASGGLGIVMNSSALAEMAKNRVMTYHSYPDWARRKRMGPFAMMETFTPSVGLSADALIAMKQAQLKSRSSRAHEFVINPVVGLAPGVDFQIGSMLALELPGDRYVVAFVTSFQYRWTTSSAPELTVQVADKPRRDPLDGAMRQLTGLATLINKAALLGP